jgi:hypothetical protein
LQLFRRGEVDLFTDDLVTLRCNLGDFLIKFLNDNLDLVAQEWDEYKDNQAELED